MKMTKLKRVADGQLNKDAYEAAEEEEEDSRFAYVPDPGQGMTRASEEVLQRRKIIKVSRKSFGSGGAAGSAMAAAGASVAPTPSSNPFVLFANLAPPTATTTSAPQEGPPAKPNPFANISFAAPSSAAAAASMAPPSKPTFSFTSSSSSAAAINTPTSTLFSFAPTNNATSAPTSTQPPTAFSFAPSNNTTTTTTTTSSTTMVGNNNNNAAIKHSNTTTTALSTPKQQSVNNNSNNNSNSSKIKELNSALAQTIIDHWEGKHYTSDYSCFMKQYQEHVDQLESEMENDDETLSNTSTSTANGLTTTMTTLSSMEGIAPPLVAPSIPSTKPFSFGTTLGGGGTTATASSAPASWAVSKPAPSFSFGGPPQTAPISHNAVGADNDDDDPTSNPDDGKIDAVLQEENSDEVVLHHVRAKHMKYQDKQWKKYGAGMLRCYRHKISNKHRLVIRNQIGKVQFNVGVSKGMMFDKVTKDGKKGKTAFVKFMAVEDASKGPEQFMLQVKPECLDSLHDILKSMAA